MHRRWCRVVAAFSSSAPVALMVLIMSCCGRPLTASSVGRMAGASAVKVKVDGKWFIDQDGRVLFFHGVNQVQKEFPWYPADLLNDTIVTNLRDWGFNVVRLGMMWSGLEVASYQYNQTYMDTMIQLVNRLSSNGIYVILDMHQDGLSSAFGNYDGMPLWLFKQLPESEHSFPWPFKAISNWFESYLTEACSHAFQQLYENSADAVGHMAGFWQRVAAAFRDNPYVLGYELINEPWAGNIYADPLLALPGEAGRRNLMPLYDQLNEAIRRVDNETIVFYEPVTWGASSDGKVAGSGFDHVPGGPAYSDRSALAYHYYCWLLNQYNGGPPAPPETRAVCDQVLMPRVFKAVQGDIKATGGASFLTEFGICTPNSGDKNFSSPCEPVVNAAYTNLQSWTYWDSIFYDDHGHVMWNVVELFSRPYAQAVAGVPIEMSYNSTTGSFSLTYECTGRALSNTDLLTEIYASKLHYPNGYKVFTSQGLQWRQDGSKLYVGATPGSSLQQPCFVGLVRLAPSRAAAGALQSLLGAAAVTKG